MNKTPDPGEVVRDKVVPAAEELVASLVERVGPLAKEAADQVSPVALAAAKTTVALAHVAAEKVAPLTHQAVEAVTPYAQHTRDAVTPYVQQVGPLAQQAADRVGPLAQQAAGAVAPYTALLVEQGRRSGQDLADRLEPALGAAKDAFTGARDKVSSDVLPAVGAAAATAATSATPLVAAATDKGRALVQSVRGEPAVVLPPPKRKRGWLTTLAVVAAAAGATYVVVRRLVGDKGSQWQTARPSAPYASPVSAEAGVPRPVAETEPTSTGPTDVVASTASLYGAAGTGKTDARTGEGRGAGVAEDDDASAIDARNATVDEVASSDEADDAPTGTAASGDGSDTSSGQDSGTFGEGGDTEPGSPYADEKIEQELETVEERAFEEPADAVWAEQDTQTGGGPAEHPQRYQDLSGVYVGVEPPEGYTIKGNERSMKFHTPDSNSYGRTIAQVWFLSEEAAEQAGFTKAQH